MNIATDTAVMKTQVIQATARYGALRWEVEPVRLEKRPISGTFPNPVIEQSYPPTNY